MDSMDYENYETGNEDAQDDYQNITELDNTDFETSTENKHDDDLSDFLNPSVWENLPPLDFTSSSSANDPTAILANLAPNPVSNTVPAVNNSLNVLLVAPNLGDPAPYVTRGETARVNRKLQARDYDPLWMIHQGLYPTDPIFQGNTVQHMPVIFSNGIVKTTDVIVICVYDNTLQQPGTVSMQVTIPTSAPSFDWTYGNQVYELANAGTYTAITAALATINLSPEGGDIKSAAHIFRGSDYLGTLDTVKGAYTLWMYEEDAKHEGEAYARARGLVLD